MKTILISGALAHDYIMSFPGYFKDHILPDKIHILSVSFLVDSFNKNFGGPGGNIAYTVAKIGGNPILFSSIGSDGEEYLKHLKESKIKNKYIKAESVPTATAHIISDKDDNQITAFYPGASEHAKNHSLKKVREKISLVIISPNNAEAMKRHAKEAHELNLPFIFDPGQQIPRFSGEELKQIIYKARFLIANDYEMELIQTKTGYSLNKILEFPNMTAVITTLGAEGSKIKTKKEEIIVPGAKPKKLIDPTGAGDAFRAGFFTAFLAGANLKECAQVGNVAALFAIEFHGTQNPKLNKKNFEARYEEFYKTKIPF